MKRNLLIIMACQFVLALYSCGGGNTDTPADQATDTITEADTLGELGGMLKDLDGRISADPNNAALYHERAYIYYRIAAYDKAMNDINRCILIDSTDATFHLTKGEIYFGQYKAEEAKTEYETALRLKPDMADAEENIGKIYMYLKNWELAIDHINASLKINPNNAEAYFMKGEIYEETGDTALAASSFQTATEQDPEYYDAFIRLGILYANAHNPLAIDYYNTAIQLQPNSIEAYYNKAIFCQDHGMVDQALELYDKILSLNKDADLAYYNKGYIYMVYKNDYERAVSMFLTTTKLNPVYKEAFHNLGLSYESLKDYPNARKSYKKALNIDPSYELSANALDRMDRLGLK